MFPDRPPPQPHPSRLTEFAGHPLVVGVAPGQPDLVALTAASMARATGARALYFGYVDASRYVDQEYADGTVRHLPISPDLADDSWMATEQKLTDAVAAAMDGQGVPWEFRYLAGRADRALTHLARAVDAAAFVVGTHVGRHHRIADFVNGSLSMQLTHRQHRPVLVVPLEVVDWKSRAPWE
jgi:nucleotide-binding universal stress UspA family protein